MKKATLLLLIFSLASLNLFSQAEKNQKAGMFPFGAGLYLAGKGGVNSVDSPEGIKNGFTINPLPDFGAVVYFPFGGQSNIGATLDLGYNSYAYQFKLYRDETVNWVDTYSYFTISPNFHLSGFLIGFNFGIPLSVNQEDLSKTIYTMNSDDLAFLVDFHIGGMIPIVVSDFGRLNLYAQAELFLTNAFKSDVDPMGNFPKFNTKPAGIKFGVSYIFNISNF